MIIVQALAIMSIWRNVQMKYTVDNYIFETNSKYKILITQGEGNKLGTIVDI